MPRPVITLTTDFGTRDSYVAQMKGVLLHVCPAARVIDVTHDIPRHDVLFASITLERAVSGFPPGTVHVGVVDPGVGTDRRILAVDVAGQTVLCPDNGLITWPWRLYRGATARELLWRPTQCSATFHGRDVFAPAAGMFARGDPRGPLCRPTTQPPYLLDVAPASAPLTGGRILCIDHFGNATTNVPYDLFRDAAHDVPAPEDVRPSSAPGAQPIATESNPDLRTLWIRAGGRSLGPLKRTYADVAPGEPLALVGSSGLLEIAVRDGSAARLLGLRAGDEIRFERTAPADPGPAPSRTQRLRELDRRHVWHPFTPMKLWHDSDPLVITEARGMHLIDGDGRRYLDGVSSLWCNVHGHRVPEIDEAVRRQLDKVAHTTMLGLVSEPAVLLADRLMKLVPPGLTKVFYSDAGATATEVAFKLAAQYWFNVGKPKKTGFVGFAGAYHGDTVGAMSVGRVPAFHRPFEPMLFTVHFAPAPYVYRSETPDDPEAVKAHCLAKLEAILAEHADTLAAVCIEPTVQGAAGMIVHPEGFLREVRRLATRYGVLLIADEVAVGFGRTGKMFACEHEGVGPDLMCAAKGLTGGYLPLAATFATREIFDAFLGDPWEGKTFYHGHTYTGNPLACAAALASLDLFEKNDLVRRVAETGVELAAMLGELTDLPHVGDVRQKGFMAGIELVEDRATRRAFDPKRRVGAEVCARVRRHGVIIRPLGDVVVLMPPPAMGAEDLRAIVAAVKAEVSTLGS